MAVAVHTIATELDRVVSAVVDSYAGRHERAVEASLADLGGVETEPTGGVRAVVSAAGRIAELLVEDGGDAEALLPVLWRLGGRGWTVIVGVPSAELGRAHLGLRGLPCRLQPWWLEDGVVHFGRLETP